MNLRHSYEQLIAQKLRKLPAPDAETSWQQMKRLLDEDDETRTAGKRNPGGGWWRIGIIAIILSASGWLYLAHTTAPDDAIVKNKANVSNNNQSSTIDKNTTLPGSATNTNGNKNDKAVAVVIPGATVTANDKNSISATEHANAPGAVITTSKKQLAFGPAGKTDNIPSGSFRSLPKSISITAGLAKRETIGDGKSSRMLSTKTASSPYIQNNNLPVYDAYSGGSNTKTPKAKTARNHHSYNYLPADNSVFSANTEPVKPKDPGQATAVAPTDWLDITGYLRKAGDIPVANTALTVGDSIENTRNTAMLLNSETKKSVAKAQRDNELETMTKKEHKLFHLDLTNAFKPFSLHMDADPRWAAGIALNSGITLGAQNRFNYSMNAKSGVLTDYIPSLYLQFHLNDYVFAQTELNFVSPQYTPQLLVYQQSNSVTGQAGISQQKSISIQKLYYFSVPVSLHYSPINNLYFSAGLQFSSFQSGLATIQEKQYATASGPDHPNSVSNTVLKFKDDSIAAKLTPNEWRWQAGAEYYFSRFTVGIRYNRSFKNLVTSDAAATMPTAAGLHNQSMLLFMRYNLFESRKKGETQKN